MTGEYQHNLDAKGRLFIPARLREELGNVFYATVSSEDCLAVYSNEVWQRMSDKASTMTLEQQKKVRLLFVLAARCEPDAQGRILLPQNLRDFAKLDKAVTVTGCNDHAEIWDSAKWDAVKSEQNTPENIAAMLREVGF